jgi:O-antigen ligase
VGAAALLITAILMGPSPWGRLTKVTALSIGGLALLLLTPYGSKIVAFLPFVGDYDAGSVDYRQQLFEVSWQVLMQNPILGSPYYIFDPAMEQMRQGEGIIDMVNTYLTVAMSSGFVGLTLFSCVFASSGIRIVRYLLASSDKTAMSHVVGRALLATLVGMLTTIATVAEVNAIPVINWCMAGACAAYVRFIQVQRSHSQEGRHHAGRVFGPVQS